MGAPYFRTTFRRDLKITRAPVVIDVIPEVVEEFVPEFGEMPEITEDAMVTFVAATE